MPTFKSKAEERRAEWLTRQSVANQASSLDTFVGEMTKESRRKHKRAAALAAARAAVVEAAMDFWHVGKLGPDEWHAKSNDADAAFNAACAALAKLEGK